MKICFYGVGGVGGYYGALVAERFLREHEIHFIARGNHRDVIREKGLSLKMANGRAFNVSPAKCTDNISEVPVCDIIILSVKGYDLANAVRDVARISQPQTIILPLLNGADIYDRIRLYLQTGIVLPSCVYIGSFIESPGVICQYAESNLILMGKDPRHPDFYPSALIQLLNDGSIPFSWEDNVQVAIWTKFMFIASFGLVSAAYDKTLGEMLDDREIAFTARQIMDEIKAVAHWLDIPLPAGIVDDTFTKARQFPYDTTTSLQRDVKANRPQNEAALFAEPVIGYGEKAGISTIVTSNIYRILAVRKRE